MNKQILRIDASLLREASCLRRVWLILNGYRSPLNDISMEFGSAFHKFKQVMRDTCGDYSKGQKAALEYFDRPMLVSSQKKYLTPTFLLKVCIDYWEHYRDDELEVVKKGLNNKPLTELKFALPYLVTDTHEVLLCGTIDEIGKIRNGCYAISDCKTTSSWNWSEYLENYELSSQLMFYYFILQKYAQAYPDSIYNEICRSQVGAMIDGIFYSASKDTIFKRSRMYYFSKQQLDEFESLLNRKIYQIIMMLNDLKDFSNKLPDRDGILVGACETKFGRCKFFQPCASPDNIAVQYLLKNNYKKLEFYDPLKFGTI